MLEALLFGQEGRMAWELDCHSLDVICMVKKRQEHSTKMAYRANFRFVERVTFWGNLLNDANYQPESIFRAGLYSPITLISHIFVLRRMAGFWLILVPEHDPCLSEQEADFFGTDN